MLERPVFIFAVFAVAVSMLCCPNPTENKVISPETDKSFIHADGRILRDEDGSEFIIKGMAFGNDVWDNPSEPPKDHHSEESYKELAELGFNSVRFYLNYGLFESDSSPYIYRRTGFDWLDENIGMAKKYGIRLVLNMHYPQGGYQSGRNGDALWTNSGNRDRLKALWVQIAEHCANEPTVLGYGLVNEPVPVGNSNISEALTLWRSFAQNMTDSIRKVDKNHLIFIERGNPRPYPGGEVSWDVTAEEGFPLIRGNDIVYEFHTYDPFLFTHQQFDWAGTQNEIHNYPENGKGKEYLRSLFDEIIKLSETRNAPIYCGEFGAGIHCFENDRGGKQWVSDMLDIFIANNISFNYHDFYEYSFGLYRDTTNGRVRNDDLAAVFSEKVGGRRASARAQYAARCCVDLLCFR